MVKFGQRAILFVAIVCGLVGLTVVDPRLAATAGIVLALGLFARSAIALLK